MASQQQEKIAREMLRLRLSQMAVNESYKAGAFKVPIHLAMGHEAIAVALSEAMQGDDALLPTHRNIAYQLARTGSLRPIMREYLLDAEAGLNHARSGSMNLLHPAKGIVYTSSILGGQFAVATGLAMAAKNKGKKAAVFVMGGDGSIEEGSFYESMLMAQSMKLPVIFVVENNEWSMSTSIEERRCPIDLSKFAGALGVRYISLSGNDPYHYLDTLHEARQFAAGESLPVCVEVAVATLGDWRGPKSEEYPEGRFINYHSGPAPEISFTAWPMIKDGEEDPLFSLTTHFERSWLEREAREQFEAIQKEIA